MGHYWRFSNSVKNRGFPQSKLSTWTYSRETWSTVRRGSTIGSQGTREAFGTLLCKEGKKTCVKSHALSCGRLLGAFFLCSTLIQIQFQMKVSFSLSSFPPTSLDWLNLMVAQTKKWFIPLSLLFLCSVRATHRSEEEELSSSICDKAILMMCTRPKTSTP